LPGYHLQTLNIYTVYASRQYLDAKIRTWVDFSREWVENALKADAIAARGVLSPRTAEQD
jgi:predicted DNA-binding protein (MmcQ/YjbR family)